MARSPLAFVRSASAGSFLTACSRRSAKGAWWMGPSRKSVFVSSSASAAEISPARKRVVFARRRLIS